MKTTTLLITLIAGALLLGPIVGREDKPAEKVKVPFYRYVTFDGVAGENPPDMIPNGKLEVKGTIRLAEGVKPIKVEVVVRHFMVNAGQVLIAEFTDKSNPNEWKWVAKGDVPADGEYLLEMVFNYKDGKEPAGSTSKVYGSELRRIYVRNQPAKP